MCGIMSESKWLMKLRILKKFVIVCFPLLPIFYLAADMEQMEQQQM